MNGAPTQIPEPNSFDTMKIKTQEWLSNINLSLERISYAVLFFALGFATGFLLRKFGRPLLLFIIGAAIILCLFQYLGLVTVHWDTIKMQLGFTQQTDFKSFMQFIWYYSKTHVLYVVSGIIGFLFGYKIA